MSVAIFLPAGSALIRGWRRIDEDCDMRPPISSGIRGHRGGPSRDYSATSSECRLAARLMCGSGPFADESGVRRRHHFHETAVPRAVRRWWMQPALRSERPVIAPAFVRDACAGIALGHSDCPGATRGFGSRNDDDLDARAEPGRLGVRGRLRGGERVSGPGRVARQPDLGRRWWWSQIMLQPLAA